MFDLFRTFVLLLTLVAPGDVQCNRPIPQATTCWVSFRNPAYTETISADNPARVRALVEIKTIERQK